jgi:hypothetical protein
MSKNLTKAALNNEGFFDRVKTQVGGIGTAAKNLAKGVSATASGTQANLTNVADKNVLTRFQSSKSKIDSQLKSAGINLTRVAPTNSKFTTNDLATNNVNATKLQKNAQAQLLINKDIFDFLTDVMKMNKLKNQQAALDYVLNNQQFASVADYLKRLYTIATAGNVAPAGGKPVAKTATKRRGATPTAPAPAKPAVAANPRTHRIPENKNNKYKEFFSL